MMNPAEAWIAWRLLFSKKILFGGSTPLALFGLILGVASLVVSMAVMSGFERTLRDALSDVTGHVTVAKRSSSPTDDWQDLVSRIKNIEPSLIAAMRFARVEAVLANQGEIRGVLLQGLDVSEINQVLKLEGRLKEGSLDLTSEDEATPALIGQGIAQRMNLHAGDIFRVVVPIADDFDPSKFSRKVGVFKVRGVLDLGKNDWNERFVITDLQATQKLAQIGNRYSGLLLRFADINYARQASFHLSQILGTQYFVTDWREVNENIFEAVRLERVVIFFVVLVIVIVAAFNISSTLFVSVMQRFSDIAILKSLGLSQKSLLRIFSFQGLFLGAIGVIFGGLLGMILSYLFVWAQIRLGLISGMVYRVDTIFVEFRFVDLFAVTLATLLICLVASLAPALRGARLNPIEGLRYG